MSEDNLDTEVLETIEREIQDLCTLSVESGLSEKHVRTLQMLVKTRQLLQGKPTEITEISDLDKALEEELDKLTPDQLTELIQKELHKDVVTHIHDERRRKKL